MAWSSLAGVKTEFSHENIVDLTDEETSSLTSVDAAKVVLRQKYLSVISEEDLEVTAV